MTIRLFYLDQHPLQMLGIIVCLVEGQLNILLFKFFFVNDAYLAVDPYSVIDTRYEEDQTDEWILIYILVGLEQPVASHVRE